MTAADARRRAWMAIFAFGAVSLFADMVYEGARAILGPFFLTLGASATVLGAAAGAGEFTGYALRLVSGRIADRTGAHWGLTGAGYLLTLVAVPMLGWVGRVDLAIVLVVAERLGKAIRSPAKSALMAQAAAPLGTGKAFGVHEALDQTGAVLGPALLAAILATRADDFRLAFGVLAIPGVLALAGLIVARRVVGPVQPRPGPTATTGGIAGPTRRYLAFAALTAIGLVPFPLVGFHLRNEGMEAWLVPTLFALAMAIDAGVALVAGALYDRKGLIILMGIPLLSAIAAAGLSSSTAVAVAGVVGWGAALGLHESVLKAAIADIADPEKRASAYGAFSAVMGVAFLAGGAALGWLYDVEPALAMSAVVVAQAVAAMMLRDALSRQTSAHPTR